MPSIYLIFFSDLFFLSFFPRAKLQSVVSKEVSNGNLIIEVMSYNCCYFDDSRKEIRQTRTEFAVWYSRRSDEKNWVLGKFSGKIKNPA